MNYLFHLNLLKKERKGKKFVTYKLKIKKSSDLFLTIFENLKILHKRNNILNII